MKAKRKRVDEEMMVIKLFSCNYARDLILNRLFSKSFAATKVENLFMFFKEANFGKRYELFLFIIYEVPNKNENRT
jgi:hypothetical protein